MGDVDASRVTTPPPPPAAAAALPSEEWVINSGADEWEAEQPPPPTPLPTEEWVLRSGAREWAFYARAAAAEKVYGLCVLDASPKTILGRKGLLLHSRGGVRLLTPISNISQVSGVLHWTTPAAISYPSPSPGGCQMGYM
jgi:hypothetical protein